MNFINRIIEYERSTSVSCGNRKFDYRRLFHVALDSFLLVFESGGVSKGCAFANNTQVANGRLLSSQPSKIFIDE
jgi:hypothetical protein